MNIHDYRGDSDGGTDYGDIVTHVCPCGNNVFVIMATFKDYEIETYSTDGECIECGSRFKVPTPVDHPDYDKDS